MLRADFLTFEHFSVTALFYNRQPIQHQKKCLPEDSNPPPGQTYPNLNHYTGDSLTSRDFLLYIYCLEASEISDSILFQLRMQFVQL